MSTISGTANFAQTIFPSVISTYIPQIIGTINLTTAILTTVYQFLKISEYMESHRLASINYGKFCRNITVELNLPIKNRSIGGNDLVKMSRNDIDRLIEQSPPIPTRVLKLYIELFSNIGLAEPELIHINKVDIYNENDNILNSTISEADLKLIKEKVLNKNSKYYIGDSPITTIISKLAQGGEFLLKKISERNSESESKNSDKTSNAGSNNSDTDIVIGIKNKWENVISDLNSRVNMEILLKNDTSSSPENNNQLQTELSELKESKIVSNIINS